ncbi:transcriptional repressor [Dactylosporangium vinaceum]|uniref:Fur family transcriptional regulator n=1 Tax=Dactylosporangium vinaceum TaxID=53362 RepID=A0ABV5M2G4_9ACTN|nr:transcriptional repressor [Dactylosporangium vinaceum]UAB96240.1 transcriptional repressor [Dactylosporangium vinaceum]
MRTADERIAAALSALRAAGGRATSARGAVLRVLAAATHLSAAEVHARLTADGLPADLSTVHRVLAALTDIGVVHVVPIGGVLTYGLADRPHHHTVCRRCGTVRRLPRAAVAAVIAAATADGTFTTDSDGRDGGVVVYGNCTACPTRPAR